MKTHMGATVPCIVAAFAALALGSLAFAQQAGTTQGPRKYLYLSNVELKPAQGSAFAKLESEEIAALRAAKAPGNYFGLWSITGGNHVLFLRGFDSFADLQKDHDTIHGMAKLAETLSTNNAAEGQLEADRHTSIYEYREDLSLRVAPNLEKMRFMQITLFHIRRGHTQQWEHLAKAYIKAYESIPNASWAMFEKQYGQGSENTFIIATPMETLGGVDTMNADDKKFAANTGADQMQLLRAQGNDIIESVETDLFALGNDISYVPDSWLTASPDFWGKK